MVKGTSKQAVIVSPGEKSGFEQAIFILSPQNSAAASSPDELLELAGDIASEYTVASLPAIKKKKLLPCVFSFLLGCAVTALAFFFLPFFGM